MRPVHVTFYIAVAGLLIAGSPALPTVASAQDLEFEQVGDIPLDAEDLEFDHEGTLWADADELYRLAEGIWEEIYTAPGIGGNLLVLSPDTLLLTSTIAVHRSTDSGQTFTSVYSEGFSLFASDLSGPNHGVVLCGTLLGGTGISYSTDRGATFTESTFTVSTSWESTLHTAVEIPDGAAEGRLVAGVFNGIVVSEDGGQTWDPSSIFQEARFSTQRVVIGIDPETGDRRLYATLTDAQEPGVQFYISDDDGLTWTNVPGMVDAFLFVFVSRSGGMIVEDEGALLAVERATALEGDSIEVWRSIDGGETWSEAGRLPAEVNGGLIASDDMLIGPEGYLYVSVGRNGPEREWVYRTTEPVVVANEPEAPPAPTEGRLVVYPNPATNRITVEASQDAEDVVLYDLLGRAVRRVRLVAGKAVLDTTRLPAGVYVVRVGGESRLVTIRR
ncbi:MAG: T9SS type A sorting domain-containing protein [Bacteroidetes bacterium]|nr:T9SS type A sorting domain-containing protein [Bacteroidota bacterium]